MDEFLEGAPVANQSCTRTSTVGANIGGVLVVLDKESVERGVVLFIASEQFGKGDGSLLMITTNVNIVANKTVNDAATMAAQELPVRYLNFTSVLPGI